MSYDAERWARSQKVGNASAKFVLIELASALNRNDSECYPSIDTLEEVTELNRKTVIASTKLLEEKGFIKKRRTFENGKQRIYYSFPMFNPLEWALKQSSKNGTLESTENGTTESTKNGTHESTVFGPVTRNKNKEKEQGIGTGSVAPSPDHFPDATKKIEEPKPKRTTTDRGSRLTITELPDDWKAFAEQEEPDLDPKRLFENFKDYWNGLSGAKAIKKDWKGTWRNFVRSFHNAEDWKRRPMLKRAPVHSPSRPGQFVEKKQSERDYFDW